MENRKVPEILMDILKDYSLVDGGRKPLLDYLNELMNTYSEMEKEYYELSVWQEEIKKELRDMKIAMKKFQEEE